MQINNQQLSSSNQLQTPVTDKPLELKQGEIYNAQIKERISETEAVLQIRGKEIKAVFDEGRIPSEDRVTVQITGQKDQSAVVKAISTDVSQASSAPQQSSADKVLQSVGITTKDITELKQSVQILLDKGLPVTKEAVQELRDFFEKAQGTAAEKLDTVKALANKRLGVSQSHLRPIHEALHGKPLNEVLSDLAKEIDPEFDLAKNEKKAVEQRSSQRNPENSQGSEKPVDVTTTKAQGNDKQSDANTPKSQVADKKVDVNTSKSVGSDRQISMEEANKSASSNTQVTNSDGKTSQLNKTDNQLSEALRKTRELIEKAPDLKKAIETLRNEILKNPALEKEVVQKIEKAAVEAEKLQSIGKDRLVQALKTAEEQLVKREQQALDSLRNSQAQTRATDSAALRDASLNEIVKEVKTEVSKTPNLGRSIETVRNQIIDNPSFPKEVVEKVQKAVDEAIQLQKQGRVTTGKEALINALSSIEKELETADAMKVNPNQSKQTTDGQSQQQAQPKVDQAQVDSNAGDTKVGQAQQQIDRRTTDQSVQSQPDRRSDEQPASGRVKQVKEEVQRDPNLQRAVEKVREQVVNNPKIDREVAQKIEKAVTEARQLQQLGRESQGRERLTQALEQAEVELKQIGSRQQPKVDPAQVQPDRRSTEQPASETVKQVKAEVHREPNLKRAVEKVREQVVNNPKIDREVAQKIEKAVTEARQLQQLGRESQGRERLTQALEQAEVELKQIGSRQQPKVDPAQVQPDRRSTEQPASETVKQVKEEVQLDPNLQRAVEKVREQIVNNPKIDREIAQKIEKAVTEARQLQQIGREATGRERLTKALEQAEVELKQIEARQQQQQPRAEQPQQENRARDAKVDPTQLQPARHSSEQPASETVKQVKEEVQRDPNLQRAVEKVRDQVVNNPKIDREIAQKIEKAVTEARQLQQIGREATGRERLTKALEQAEVELKQIEARQQQQQPRAEQPQQESRPKDVKVDQTQTKLDSNSLEQPASEVVKQTKEQVQRDQNLQRAVEKVREQVVNNPKIDREVAQKIEKAVTEARQLQQLGRETVGRERLTQALEQAEIELKQIEARQPQPKVDQTQVQPDRRATEQAVASQPDRRPTEQPASETVKQVKEEVQRDPNLQRAVEKVREQIVNNPKIDREVAQQVEKAVNEARQLQQLGREAAGRERLTQALEQAEVELKQIETRQQPKVDQAQSQPDRRPTEQPASETVKQVKEEVQRDQNLQRAVEKVREQVVNNPKVDYEVAQKIDKAVNEARQLQQLGRESQGRDRLTQALEQAEVELKQIEARQPQQQPKVDQAQVDSRVRDAKVDQAQQQVDRRAPEQSVQSHPDRRPIEQPASETVKQVKEEVRREPNLQRAVEKVREQIVNNPKIDREVAQQIEKAVSEARQLQQVGRESVGRDRLTQALEQAEAEQKQIESRQIQQQPKVDQSQPDSLPRDGKVNQTQSQSQPENSLPEKPASEVVKQAKEEVRRDQNLQRAVEKVRDLIVNNKQIDPETLRNIERIANQANQLDQAGRDRIAKVLEQIENTLKQNETQTPKLNPNQNQSSYQNQNTNQNQPNQPNQQNQTKVPPATNQQQNNILTDILDKALTTQPTEKRPSELMKDLLKHIQKEPSLDKALEHVRKETSSNPNLDLKMIEKVEKAIDRASQLQEKGRELAARQHITNSLTEIAQELAKTEPPKQSPEQKVTQEALQQIDINEQLQSMSLQSKNILVTKVTQKLAQATHDFRELKREITRNLDNIERLVNTYKNNAYPQTKQILETTISKLDNAILKSEMMLFTDMKTEKQLMQASTQLADAKKLLAKGNHSEAAKIVHDIKTLIDKINFKPSEQKVMHYVSKESLAMESRSPSQQLLNHFDETARSYVRQEPSARQMFEMVRSMGLNHDSDLAKSLVFQKGGDSSHQNPNQQSQQDQQQQQNLKATLMKLAQTGGDEASTKVAQQAEQALNNLTGQQLLSKSDSGNSLQSMFFNLPLMLGEKPENLQVFVNSKNEGQQVDWENCNLYFLLETKKLGDVGIMLSSTERNLSITIKNDKPGFKQKMEPIAAITKEKLQEIGYNVNSINFTRMTAVGNQPTTHTSQPTNSNHEQKPTRPVFTEKGMDFKI